MSTLYHYTCQHGRIAIGAKGTLLTPKAQHSKRQIAQLFRDYRRELKNLIWLTDLDVPHAEALGLTSYSLPCDRTQHRYRVADDAQRIGHWMQWRGGFNPRLVHELESASGAMPMHWWITSSPVPVVYDPINARVRA